LEADAEIITAICFEASDYFIVHGWIHNIADRIMAIHIGIIKGSDPEMLPERFQVAVKIVDTSKRRPVFTSQSKSARIFAQLSHGLFTFVEGNNAPPRLDHPTFSSRNSGYSQLVHYLSRVVGVVVAAWRVIRRADIPFE